MIPIVAVSRFKWSEMWKNLNSTQLSFFKIKVGCKGINIHYENLPMQYTEIFKVVKNEKIQ